MKRASWQLSFLLCLGALLSMPAPVSASVAPDCECVPGTAQVAPGPGGCTLRRECKEGSSDGTCRTLEWHELGDDGVVTITQLTGYWTPWTETCVKEDTSAVELESLFKGLNR